MWTYHWSFYWIEDTFCGWDLQDWNDLYCEWWSRKEVEQQERGDVSRPGTREGKKALRNEVSNIYVSYIHMCFIQVAYRFPRPRSLKNLLKNIIKEGSRLQSRREEMSQNHGHWKWIRDGKKINTRVTLVLSCHFYLIDAHHLLPYMTSWIVWLSWRQYQMQIQNHVRKGRREGEVSRVKYLKIGRIELCTSNFLGVCAFTGEEVRVYHSSLSPSFASLGFISSIL